MKQKKRDDPPKKRSKKRYSSKRRRSKKIGDTRIEYERDVKHIKNIKNIFEIKFFFFEKNAQKMMRRFENEGFFLFQEAEKKQQIGDAKRDPKSFFLKKKSKTLVPRRKEKWNKKRHVF